MTKKTILTSVLLSMVAASMVACSGHDSKKGQAPVAKAIDNSFEAQQKTFADKLIAQEEEHTALNAKAEEISVVLLEVETAYNDVEKKYQEAALKIDMMAKGHVIANTSDVEKSISFLKEDRDNAKVELDTVQEESDEVNARINFLIRDMVNTKNHVDKLETQIDIRDLKNTSDYKIGDIKVSESVERKEAKFMKLSEEIGNYEGTL